MTQARSGKPGGQQVAKLSFKRGCDLNSAHLLFDTSVGVLSSVLGLGDPADQGDGSLVADSETKLLTLVSAVSQKATGSFQGRPLCLGSWCPLWYGAHRRPCEAVEGTSQQKAGLLTQGTRNECTSLLEK